MFDGDGPVQAPGQIERKALIPVRIGFHGEVIELGIGALPALTQDRKPGARLGEELQLVVEPHREGRIGES